MAVARLAMYVGNSMQNEAEEGKKLAHKGFYRGAILVLKQLIARVLVLGAGTCTLVQLLHFVQERRGVHV